MKRFLLIVLFLLVGFYVAWPAYSVWQIHSAVQSGDAAVLQRKIDFRSVRASLLPVVEGKISKQIEQLQTDSGAAGALLGGVLKGGVLGQMTQVVLDHLVTADNIIKLSRQSGTLNEKIERLVSNELGKIGGGLGALTGGTGGAGSASGLGSVGETAKKFGIKVPGYGNNRGDQKKMMAPKIAGDEKKVATEEMSIGFSNIKAFGFTGPLGFEVGVAKDAKAKAADVKAQMSFMDFDWKLTRIVPVLK